MKNLNLELNEDLKENRVSTQTRMYPEFKPRGVMEMVEGIHYTFSFPNRYGASVIKNPGSYGYEKDLWELALIYWDEDGYTLSYHDIVGGDVLGDLTDAQVNRVLEEIKKGNVDTYIDDLYDN